MCHAATVTRALHLYTLYDRVRGIVTVEIRRYLVNITSVIIIIALIIIITVIIALQSSSSTLFVLLQKYILRPVTRFNNRR